MNRNKSLALLFKSRSQILRNYCIGIFSQQFGFSFFCHQPGGPSIYGTFRSHLSYMNGYIHTNTSLIYITIVFATMKELSDRFNGDFVVKSLPAPGLKPADL